MSGGRWVLDVGNTRTKLASPLADGTWTVFEDAEAVAFASRTSFEPEAVLVSASGSISDAWTEICDRWGRKCVRLNPEDAAFFPRTYTPWEALGLDRIANAMAVGAEGTWAVIDAGTCITCDLIDAGCFRGGSIAPGLAMRLQAMHTGTARLPLLRLEEAEDCALGTSTSGSMGCGALHGARLEVEGRIAAWKATFPGLRVALTGGDAERLALSPPVPIFADPMLTFRGYFLLLNRMLS